MDEMLGYADPQDTVKSWVLGFTLRSQHWKAEAHRTPEPGRLDKIPGL